MMARGFKPVGWVAAVAGAALGCYMLSLNVAAERAELAKLERRIIAAKQDIRSLQTELGTRGRMQQLEHWNANVLALSAPTSAQFLDNELTLARFDVTEPTLDNPAPVRMASAEARKAEAKPQVRMAAAQTDDQPVKQAQPLVRKAALVMGSEDPAPQVKKASLPVADAEKPLVKKASLAAEEKPRVKKAAAVEAKPAAVKKPKMIDTGLVNVVRASAKSETSGGGGGR